MEVSRSMSDFPKRKIRGRLSDDPYVVVTNEPNAKVIAAVLVNENFESLKHISKILDKYNLEVSERTWVDEGQKFFVQPR